MTTARPSLTIPAAIDACVKHSNAIQPTATLKTMKIPEYRVQYNDNAEKQR